MLARYPGTEIGARQSTPFRAPISKPRSLKPEANPWFWHPDRVGAGEPPLDFAKQLKQFDPELRVTWNPHEERWYVWVRKPNLHTRLCNGWMLLFPIRYPDGSYMPLDNRIFAQLYYISAARWGNGLRYFDRILAELDRDEEKRVASRKDSVGWLARDYWKHTQPSVSMCGPSNGSKTANNN